MEIEFLISAILFLLCLGIRSMYETLKEAHKASPESKPIFIVVLLAMCILWLSWFKLCPIDPIRSDLPIAARWIGLVMLIAGTILAVGAVVQLKGASNIDHLVTTGLFRRIRHPMYAGFIFWILGWSLYHSALMSLAIGMIGIANILWWRHLEERRLEVQFGSTYQDYRLTTWF